MEDPALWTGLTQQLAGLFSASLNKMDATTVIAKNISSPVAQQLDGVLSREELCTENISPWLKLLPCRTHAGLGAWIRPVALLDADFLSLALHIVNDSARGTLHLHQSITAVRRVEEPSWSLQSVLGLPSSISTPVCPLVHSSAVVTDLAFAHSSATPSLASTAGTDPSTHRVSFSTAAATAATPWLRRGSNSAVERAISWRGVSGHRYLTGYGQVRGGVGLRLTNHHLTKTLRVRYHESIPWYMRVYFSSVRLQVNGQEVDILAMPSFRINVPPAIGGLQPPFELEFVVDLAPQSAVVMAYSFDKTFLPMGLHPPDSNRGFDVPAASWSVDNATYYTESLLVPLPTPDFSMPYNVIVLTSTVVGMSIAIVLNTLLNRHRRTNLVMTLVQDVAARVKTNAAKQKTE
ncbi:hypothetical protein DYB32_002065 [Aphanomyces invadans]|uniref:GPI transamidase component PIG-T n=1 Tax=Aphanomyces invadans TaxID=157072 RepID=A0A418B4D4_9STRA|nr:hypothetical protein DYB32_002065 [Aphanomyces invadans]